MTEVVVDPCQDQLEDQGLGQIQESVQIETESGVINVGNMTTLLVIAPNLIWMRNQTNVIQTVNKFTNFGT